MMAKPFFKLELDEGEAVLEARFWSGMDVVGDGDIIQKQVEEVMNGWRSGRGGREKVD
jgi:hypothetical protein